MAQLANLTTTLALESASFVNGIEQSRGAVRRLVASLDPAAAAQAKFNRQMDLAERGLKSGQLSAELYERVVGRLRARLDEARGGGERLTQTSGMMRAGFQQLGYQLGDISQGFATGTAAATIFAQQSGQVIQSLQLMTTETKGVLAVLGGPWGAVLSAALVAATPLVAKLFEGNDALGEQVNKLQENAAKQEIAAQANRVFSTTQAGLDQRIRETTNAINQQNASLRTNAELQNINAKIEFAQAQKKLADAQSAVRSANARVAQLSTPGAMDPRLAGAKQDAADSLDAARLAARQAQQSVQDATAAVISSRVALAAEQAQANAAAATGIGKITKQYDDQIKSIRLTAAAAAAAGKDVSAAEYVRIKQLELAKQAAIDSYQAQESAAKKASTAAEREARHAAAEAAKQAKANAKLIADIKKGARDAARDLAKIFNRSQDDIRRAQEAQFKRIFGDDADGFADIAEKASTAYKAEQDAYFQGERELQRVREDNIRDLSDMYFDLFDGGTKRWLQNFQRQAMSVFAQLLAQWTMNAFNPKGGGGGGFFASIGKAVGGLIGVGGGASFASADLGGFTAGPVNQGIQFDLPGFASGGSFQFGGRDGIDKNILSLNGSPIARVSKGETAHIGRGSTDGAPIVFDLRGAVMTDDLLRQMNALAASNAINVVGEAQMRQAKKAGRRFG